MKRFKLAILVLLLVFGFLSLTTVMDAGAAGVGGTFGVGGTTPSLGGTPSIVRRRVGNVVEGTSYLAYLCLVLGLLSVLVISTSVVERKEKVG